jgi:hypothetical protein
MTPSVRMPVPPTEPGLFQQLPVVALMPRDEPVYNPARLPGENLHSASYTNNPVVDRTLIFGNYFLLPFYQSFSMPIKTFILSPGSGFFQNLYSFILNWFFVQNLLFFHFAVEYESIPRVTTRMFNSDPSFQQPATVQVVPDRASFSPMPLVNLTSTDMGHVFTRPLPTATYYRPRQIFVRPPRPSAPSPQLVPVVASSSSATSAMETSRPSTPAPPSDASSF